MILTDTTIQFDPVTKQLQAGAYGTDLTLSAALSAASGKFSTGINIGSSINQAISTGVIKLTNGASGGELLTYDGSYREQRYNALEHRWKISNTFKLRLDSATLYPDADYTIDLGAAALYRFNRIFAKGLNLGTPSTNPSTGQLFLANGATGGLISSYDGSDRPLNYNASYHAFQLSGSEVMRLTSSNTLILGSTNNLNWTGGSAILQLGDSNAIYNTNTTTQFLQNNYISSSAKYSTSAAASNFTLGNTLMRFSTAASGTAGNATGAMTTNLDVQAATFTASATTSLAFQVSGVEKFRVHSNGFVGILTNNPTAPLTIKNDWISSIGQIRLEASDYSGFSLYDASGNAKVAEYYSMASNFKNHEQTYAGQRQWRWDPSNTSYSTWHWIGAAATFGYDIYSATMGRNIYYNGSNWVRQIADGSAGILQITPSVTVSNYGALQFSINNNTTASAGSNTAPIRMFIVGPVSNNSTSGIWLGPGASPSNTNYTLAQSTAGHVYLNSNGGETYINRSGTTFAQTYVSGAYAWYIQGNGYANGGTWVPSDERLKTNIHNVGTVLDKLMELQPVTYEWNDIMKGRSIGLEGNQVGIIAQKAMKLFPDIIHTIRHPNVGIDKKYHLEDVDYYTADYSKLSVYTLAGLQELVSILSTKGVI